MVFPSLIIPILFAVSLSGQEARSTAASPTTEPKTTPLLVCDYADLLQGVASSSDRHHLYHSSLSDQIVQVMTGDKMNYLIVPGRENRPIEHLIDHDVMRYCNWRDHNAPTSGVDLDEVTEHGTYEFSNDDQLITTDSEGEYQVA